jgi:hypothetical protein
MDRKKLTVKKEKYASNRKGKSRRGKSKEKRAGEETCDLFPSESVEFERYMRFFRSFPLQAAHFLQFAN